MKKRMLSLALMLALVATPAFAADNSAKQKALDKNTENMEVVFKEKKTLPMWLFSDLKEMDNGVATINTKAYSLTFYSETVGELDKRVERYDFGVTRQTDKLDDYYAAVGEKTPKYVLLIPGTRNVALPAATTITMHDASFVPGSNLYVYRVLGDQKYEPIDKEVVVTAKGDFSFTITQTGTYFVSSREIAKRLNTFFERDIPELNPVDELLGYLNEESRYDFSGLISRAEIG